ncbi:serine acetyltransferase [Limosilactobacillus gastricus]|uniref:serine acetyltransferase n=2 Tax=Limosilactobacillus gastricus TaxID=227942 RepID=UPI000704F4BD|nr:serine acetyltransferase [Limosilactobacillus gastricus]QGF40717.1 serine acetyltransferase [Limosilactobacillus gastricus]
MMKELDKKGKLILNIYKYGQKHYGQSGFWHHFNYKVYKVLDIVFILGLFGSEIQVSQSISSRIYLYHPYGIIINRNSVIGDGCIIRQQVTIGNKGIDYTECPIIGENVEIGAGAKIIGNIKIGSNSKIGANAVVTKSFPENSILVGVPARNISREIYG